MRGRCLCWRELEQLYLVETFQSVQPFASSVGSLQFLAQPLAQVLSASARASPD